MKRLALRLLRPHRRISFRSLAAASAVAAALVGLLALNLRAQTPTTGSITGVITDPSGAVLPGAQVTLRNLATGATLSGATNGSGDYHFSLLQPGTYQLSATAHGFQTTSTTAAIAVGQNTTANLKLSVGAATQTVTVSSEAPLVQTNNGNISTSFTQQQIALVPNPGNDLTAIAQTAPGAVMNTQSGYGNFETYGLPATANLFTINGMDENDPYLNLNNSGATNLLIGKNDVQEASVVNNGYTGQYGRLVGANVNYVSKSGGNQWHGNAIYNWNGRALNANNFFNNANSVARPFDNANQWSWSFGGPIIKNKTFFFVDQEGLYVLIPTNTAVNIPSPQFQAATLANIAATDPAAVPFYTGIFKLYNAAPGASGASAAPLTTPGEVNGPGCGSFALLGGAVPCALQFRSTAGNRTHEWDLFARVDQNLSNSDKLFFQFGTDHGLQATYTDPISSVFNAQSVQPQYSGQLQETHVFGSGSVNQLNLSSMWYSAVFTNPDRAAALAAFPTTISFAGSGFAPIGGEDWDWPQGRKVTQYQASDDVTVVMGAQTVGFGFDFRRDQANDYTFGIGTSGNTGPYAIGLGQETLGDFYAGTATTFQQSFATTLNQPIRDYNLGFYLQDQINVSPDFKMTLAFRADHNSNPICGHFCFSHLAIPFTYLAHDATVPYNAIIQTGQGQAFVGYRHWGYQPRFGFAWTPFGSKTTVLRGGFGIFDGSFPVTVADNFATNSPNENTFTVGGKPLTPGAGGMMANAAANNTAFVTGFNSGLTEAAIAATTPAFVPPNFFTQDSVVDLPRYQEWNLEIQHQLGVSSAFSINYVGNHGVHESMVNNGLNAFCPATACAGGFAGLPAAPTDPRFGVVSQLFTGASSNYNGLSLAFTRKFTAGFEMQLNYTWSHALDWVSNGGLLPFNLTGSNQSLLFPQDPYNVRGYNYGNADYDVRHYFSANYVWQVPFHSVFHWGPSELWQGWQLAGTIFARTGLPFTVIDSAATGTLAGFNYGGTIFGNELSQKESSCGISGPCIVASEFSPSTTTPTAFGNQIRNQFRGPRFFDTDLNLSKNTQIPGWEKAQLGIGVQAFNLFNHPNFDAPPGDLANPNFGTVINTVSVPTSILGAFLGGDASPRIIELTAKLSF